MVSRLTPHIIAHLGDESFQAVDCTSWYNQKQGTKHYIHLNTKEEQEKVPQLTKQTTP